MLSETNFAYPGMTIMGTATEHPGIWLWRVFDDEKQLKRATLLSIKTHRRVCADMLANGDDLAPLQDQIPLAVWQQYIYAADTLVRLLRVEYVDRKYRETKHAV